MTSLVVSIAQLMLAVTLCLAAVTKLWSKEDFEGTLRAVGFSEVLCRPVAIMLPMAELALAIAIIFPETAALAAVGIIILCILFITTAVLALRASKVVACHCFGELGHHNLGYRTIGVNLLLICGGLVVLLNMHVAAGVALIRDFGREYSVDVTVVIGLFVVLLVQFVFNYMMARQRGELLIRLENLETAASRASYSDSHPPRNAAFQPVGSIEFSDGSKKPLGNLIHGQTILLLLDSECPSCVQIINQDLANWREVQGSLLLAVLTDRPAFPASAPDLGWFSSPQLVASLGYKGTPAARVISEEGLASGQWVYGREAISMLVNDYSAP